MYKQWGHPDLDVDVYCVCICLYQCMVCYGWLSSQAFFFFLFKKTQTVLA